MTELDYDIAPVSDEPDEPSELEVVREVFGTTPDDPILDDDEPSPTAGPEHELSLSGWEGPSPGEWQQTRAAVAQMAQTLERQGMEQEFSTLDDPSWSLDPLDESFEGNLAELLAARDQALVYSFAKAMQPYIAALTPLHERASAESLAEGQDKLEAIMVEETRRGSFNRELARELAANRVSGMMQEGQHVDDAVAEQVFRAVVAELRGPRRARSGGSGAPKPPRGGDATEADVVSRMFGSGIPAVGRED